MMISSFLRVGAAILALSLASPSGHVKADGGVTECATETSNLLIDNSGLSAAATDWGNYINSLCGANSTDPACMVTASADGSSVDVTYNFTGTHTNPLFVNYKNACLTATGNLCYASLDGKVTGSYNDLAMEITLDIIGIPSCTAKVCNETEIQTLITSAVQDMADVAFGSFLSDAQTDFQVTNVTCET